MFDLEIKINMVKFVCKLWGLVRLAHHWSMHIMGYAGIGLCGSAS